MSEIGPTPGKGLDDALNAEVPIRTVAFEPNGNHESKPGFFVSSHSSQYPIDALPESLRRLVDEGARSVGVPPEYIAPHVLALSGGVIGRNAIIRLKQGFEERPTIWTAIVGQPGTAKTPALAVARYPVDRLQAEASSRYADTISNFEPSASGNGDGAGRVLVYPGLEHFYSTDTTPEAIGPMLATSSGITLVNDELVGFVKRMDGYHQRGERQLHLSCWSGGAWKTDRKTQQPLFVLNPVICVTGNVQPDLLRDLADDAGRRDGFVERFNWVWPETVPSRWTVDEVSDQANDLVIDSYRAIRGWNATPRVFFLSELADTEFVAWYNDKIEEASLRGGILGGFLSKLPIQVARFALILHSMECPRQPPDAVSLNTIRGAIQIGEFHFTQAERVVRHLDPAGINRSGRLRDRVIRILESDNWLSTTVIHAALGGHTSADDLHAVLNGLVAEEIAETHPVGGTGGRNRDEWRLK